MNFLELHDIYYIKVRQFILSLVKDPWAADDLIQDTFVKVKHSLDNVRDPERVSSWIFKIAYNLCQDHFKSRHSIPHLDIENIKPSTTIPTIKSLEQKQMADCIQDKMNLLPESLRSIIFLYDVCEFTHKEIADILSITPENSKVRLSRARKQLKAILNEHCQLEYDERNVLVCLPVKFHH